MWFWLAMGAALLGAVELIYSKHAVSKVSSTVLAWSVFALSIPPLVVFVALEGIPSVNQTFLIATAASSIVFIYYKVLIYKALKHNLVSKIIPLTAFSGLFTYVLGLILLSETLRPIPILGLICTMIGAYILNADQAREDFLKPIKLLFSNKYSLYFLFAVFLSSTTAVLDKMGIINTKPISPIFVILVEQVLQSVILFFFLLNKEQTKWFKEVKDHFWVLLINSLIFLAVGFLVFYAYTDGPVALVLGIKRLQIFLVLILGYIFFKDKPTKHSWVATAVMVLGAVLIKIG